MKRLVFILILALCMSTGCVKTSSEQQEKGLVYCSHCGAESDETSKYCKECGNETEWLDEKPTSNSSTYAEKKEEVIDSRKEEFLIRINQVDNSMSDLDYLYESGTTMDMCQGEYEKAVRWDNLLNEIYGVLKEQLSSNEMDELRNKQREWISYRDNEADKAAKEFEGGTWAPVAYNGAIADLTRERCYYLVNNYMK